MLALGADMNLWREGVHIRMLASSWCTERSHTVMPVAVGLGMMDVADTVLDEFLASKCQKRRD